MKTYISRFRHFLLLLRSAFALYIAGIGAPSGMSLKARADTSDTVGVPWAGEAGVTETVANIMARDRLDATQLTRQARSKPVGRTDRGELPPNPDSPTTSSTPESATRRTTMQPGGRYTPQTTSTSFTGATLADTGAYPPDTMGAVGPSQFIVAVNGRIRSFDKTAGVADGALNVSTDVFFASVMTPVVSPVIGNFTSDPHIRYDRLSGRWFIVMIDVPYIDASQTTVENRILIAVSSGSTITGSASFTFYQFRHDQVSTTGDTGDFADYPTPGIDANALYIGDNVFSNSTGSFVGTSGFVVRKSSLLSGGPIVVTAFRGLATGSGEGPDTPQGVDNFDPAATEGYFIGKSNAATGRLVVRRISNPGGTPTISANILLTVSSTASPITVPHPGNTGGTNGNLDALDTRLFAAHIRNGRLWTAHNIQVDASGTASGSGGRNGSRWYELQNLTGTPAVVQSGTVFDPAASNPKSYWIPSIMVSGQGHAAMGFSTAGASNNINAGTVGRLAGDTLGTMQTPQDYTASSTAYNPPGNTGGASGRRWGDYSYTSLDPNDDMTMWTIQEFCDATNSYAVRAVKLIAPPPATPSGVSQAVTPGTSNVNVVITGTSGSGSGFFDPGAGFANRIGVSVSGTGVTVNSVTFTSPTQITLNVSVSTGAALGARTVTVTNPDGQVATSAAGIFTVAAASVTSLTRADPDPANASTVNWTLAFNSAVAGVTTGNFSLSGTATAGASIGTPTTGNGGVTWNVPVTTGPVNGSLTLNLVNSTGQSPTVTTALPFIGETYTINKTAPTVTTPASTAITATGATLGGNVTGDGGFAITERGVVYSATAVNSDPIIGGTGVTKVTSAGTTGIFTVSVSGLTAGTSYSFKACATNSIGTTYTTPVSTFTTLAAPTVTTPASASITVTSATLGGNVTSDGGTTITERGVVYSVTTVNSDPSIGGTGVTKLTGTGTTGVFTVNATGLAQGTGYSFKAYATNSVGTTYTTPASTFTTLAVVVLTGTKSIGPGGDYVSLTNAGGLFEAINTNGVNGLLSVQITGDLTAETGTVVLNALTGTTPSVKIFPTGAAHAISGTSAGALIRLNAADNVTLDGSLGGTGVDRSLSVTNTNIGTSSAVIWLQNSGADGATNNTIRNLSVAGSGNTQTLIGIGSGSSTISTASLSTGNNGNTIQNNSISKTQYGIVCQGLSAAAKNTGTVITQNLINTPSPNHVAKIGILVGFQNGIQVTQNTVDGMTFASSTDTVGISLGITSISATGFTGNEVTNATVTRNSIGKVTHTGTYSAVGIAVASAASGTTLIANNFISGVAANCTSPDIGAGIFLGGGTGSTTQVYNNSISMTGTVTGTTAASYPSYALAIGGTTPVVDVRNNVLLFTQVTNGTTPIGYAIGTAATIFANLTSNNNVMFTSTGALFAVGKTGGLSTSGTTQTTLANWQAATGKDANSVFGDPLFTYTTNLHITSLSSPVSNAGTPLAAVPVDFDGGTRSAATPDIGADEFGASNLPAVSTPTQTAITANTATLGGNVTDDGGTAITERGVVYSVTATNSDPLIGGAGVTKVIAAGTTGVFAVNATGLGTGTGYSFKAYAINAAATGYTGPVATFTTLTALNNWRLIFYGTTSNTGSAADASDPYGTGVPNLAVFAVLGPNQNPAQVAAGMLPQPQISGGNYVITFTQPAGVSGVIYSAEWSITLLPGSWTPIFDSGSGGTHTFSVLIGGNQNLFIRLRVSTP